MDIYTVKDFAKIYLRLWYSDNKRQPVSINELMSVDMKSGDGPLMNDICLRFGQHAGKGLWEAPPAYRSWLTEQVKFYLQTHSWGNT